MFAKLLKYEWKASSNLLLLLSGCALGIGCVAAVILRLLTTYWDRIMLRDELVLILIPAILFLFFAYFALLLYATSSQYILLYRFYKSRFTDEGYLMFTLPVKTSHIFLSNAVHMLIWAGITLVVMLLSIGIAVVLGPVWDDTVLREMRMAFSDMDWFFSELTTPWYPVTIILSGIILSVYGIVAPMTAVVLGSAVAKKHKILAIIGIMIGISTVVGTANGIISAIMQFILIGADSHLPLVTTLAPLASSIFPLILTIAGYFISIHLMKNRLNLP